MTDPASIRLLVLDVDGVLTDGSILIDDNGVETKRFNVRDGLAITTWLRLGFEVGIITRRIGHAVQVRMTELGVANIVQGSKDKAAAIEALAAKTGIPAEQMAFVGDDWPDLAAMNRVGYPVAVADAAEQVRNRAVFTTSAQGGRGAVRETVEHLLRAKGQMDEALGLFS